MDFLFWAYVMQQCLCVTLFLNVLSFCRSAVYSFRIGRNEPLPLSVMHFLVASIDLLVLGMFLAAQRWFGVEFQDAFRNAVSANFIFAGFGIWDDQAWKSFVFGYVSSITAFCSVGLIWQLHPVLVLVLLVLPQVLGVYTAMKWFYKEKALSDSWRESSAGWEKLHEDTKKDYMKWLALEKQNNQLRMQNQQMKAQHQQRIFEFLIQIMYNKMMQLETGAENAAEECEKIKREKEELEQKVNDLEKTHKAETASQKENLSRAVSLSQEEGKVSALREENKSMETELTLSHTKFDQVENDLERLQIERDNLLAIIEKLKDDLNRVKNQN